MKRRQFITLFCGTAAAWPFAARAQQPAMPLVGFLASGLQSEAAHMIAAFTQGLREVGYIDGQNVAIEYRFAQGRYDQLGPMAEDLVRRRVSVIVGQGGPMAGLAAKTTTRAIPIVFITSGDPVRQGLVTNLGRPEGNATGVTQFASALTAKRLELLRELVRKPGPIAALFNPNNPSSEEQIADVQVAARSIGQDVQLLSARDEREIETAFESMAGNGVRGVLIGGDAFFVNSRRLFVQLGIRRAMPAIFNNRIYVVAGGLISYGALFQDIYRQAGVYAGRIVGGAKPAELPVLLPTKFELVINLKTARALNVTVPLTLQAAADEVIE